MSSEYENTFISPKSVSGVGVRTFLNRNNNTVKTSHSPASFGRVEFLPEEYEAIERALHKKLGPNFISQRAGPGGQKLAYIEGWRIISLANEIFGFNGWSHSVTDQTIDFVDHYNGRYFVGVSAKVRVELKDGEAVTDGLKRALKSFGNALGNCLSNKEYVQFISRSKQTIRPLPIDPKTLLENEEQIDVSKFRKNTFHHFREPKYHNDKQEPAGSSVSHISNGIKIPTPPPSVTTEDCCLPLDKRRDFNPIRGRSNSYQLPFVTAQRPSSNESFKKVTVSTFKDNISNPSPPSGEFKAKPFHTNIIRENPPPTFSGNSIDFDENSNESFVGFNPALQQKNIEPPPSISEALQKNLSADKTENSGRPLTTSGGAPLPVTISNGGPLPVTKSVPVSEPAVVVEPKTVSNTSCVNASSESNGKAKSDHQQQESLNQEMDTDFDEIFGEDDPSFWVQLMTQELQEAKKEEENTNSFAHSLGLFPSRTHEKYCSD
ncbi:DNA repair protein RAD52-like protein, partial [Armadillidium nasatum]